MSGPVVEMELRPKQPTEFMLIDLSSLAHPIWHTQSNHADQNVVSQKIAARVHALSAQRLHVAVCCDSGPSFRKQIAPSYKANRPEQEAGLQHQISLAAEMLESDGFPLWRAKDFEADDVIATATRKALEIDGATVVIVTGDKDLLQLVTDRVTAISARDGNVLDAEAVRAKFGVTPAQMRDYLTLVGDSSDNVKGAAGIGPKKAAALLSEHGTLDALYAKLDAGTVIGVTPGMRTSLMDFRPYMPTTRELITLRADVEIPFNEILRERERTVAPLADEGEDMDTEDTIETPAPAAQQPPAPEPAPASTAVALREPDVLAPAPAEWERQLEPRSMRELKTLAQDMHNSRLFLSAYGTPQAVMSTLLAGRELGLQAMASLRAIHIVEGRPTLSADLIRALVIRSGLAKYFRCTERTAERATFETQRGDDPPISLSYTILEATAAGLVKDKSGWVKSPADMLVARASAKLARLVYPDVVHGIYTPEEVDEIRTAVAS